MSFVDIFILVTQILLIIAPFAILTFILILREKERKRIEKRDAAMRPKIISYGEYERNNKE